MPPAVLPQQTQLRLRAFALALEGRGICILHQTRDQRFDLAEHLPPIWTASSILGKDVAEFMTEGNARLFSEAAEKCIREQEAQDLELELSEAGRTSVYLARLVPDEDGVLTTLSDVSEQRNREAAIAALLREVSHRSKNLLAIVQSVAMQTANHSGSITDFLDKFRGRLHALSSTQDLVTDSDWRGTPLHTLLAAQLRRVHSAAYQNVHVSGDNPVLTPNAALHVGLAIHELAVNAAAYGALSVELPGQIWFDAHVSDEEPGALVLEWRETFPTRAAAAEPRFGTLILERIVPLSVGGQAEFTLDPSYVTYRLEVPAGEFEA